MNYFTLFNIQKIKKNLKSSLLISGAILLAGSVNAQIQLIYTSDSHYGITRTAFQGATNVDAHVVNAAMVAKLNGMSLVTFPNDNGVKAGQVVGPIDYVINTGDIANRQESAAPAIQSATASWAQFNTDYINGLTLKDKNNQNSKLLLLPGNHDVSNAIGFYKAMSPTIDKTAMVNIYNLMMNPTTLKDVTTYNYTTDKVNYSKNIGGVHFMFLTLWPDSTNRKWMDTDLANVSSKTPVVIFTHDQPDIETKHLHNPNGLHDVNATDKFENMVEETCKDGKTVSAASTLEQRGFALWVQAHPNVKAYFHGNSNANEYYMYKGPDNNIALRTIRVDSPMKGNVSATDQTKLSYQIISLDSVSKNLTVRECLWNPTSTAGAPIQWGASITFALSKADSLVAVANTLTETNYTIPSWTLLKRAIVAASAAKDSASTSQLQSALNGLKANTIPYNVNMTINGNPSSRMGFAWYTNKGVAKGRVEIVSGKVTSAAAFNVPSDIFYADTTNVTTNYNVSGNSLSTLAGITDNSKRSYSSHKVVAWGLQPNITYSYRVGTDGAWSDIGTFTTAKSGKDAFSFIYFTDPQANTDDMFTVSQKTTHTAKAMFPNANFALTCGDLVESSGSSNSEWEYEQFFATQQDIWNTTPLAPVMGNHDNSTNRNFSKHFNTAVTNFDKNMSTVPGSVYSFVYGDALFMAFQSEDYAKTSFMDSVKIWMKQQVAANPTVKWRIAFYHKTMYTGSSSHQSDADGKAIRDYFTPVFDSLKIDLALQGHDHVYEVIGPLKAKALVTNAVTNQVVSTPSTLTTNNPNMTGKFGGTFDVQNGTLYFLNNSAGKKKYQPRTEAQMNAVATTTGISDYFSYFTGRFGQTGEPTFSNISVSSDSINIATYTVNDNGVASLFDNYKVIKTADTPADNIARANKLVEANYTVPTWTKLKRALVAITATPDSTNNGNLKQAISNLKANTSPYSIVTSINGNPASRLGFAWFTNIGVTGGKVEIVQGTAADYTAFITPLFSINAKCDSVKNLNYNVSANGLLSLAGIADNTKKSYMKNKALATGLTPNTTYSYRVGKPGAWSEIGTFTTAKNTKDKFSFVYITDTQAQTDAMFNTTQTTTHAASAMYPGANFWLGCGDLIESSGTSNSEWEYEQFFQTQQDIFLKKPFASVIGNHDFTTNKNFTHHFNTDSIGFDQAKSTVPGSIYSFVYGDALFMAFSSEDYSLAGQLDSTANWMRRTVAANPNTKWRIAFYHKTIYTGSSSHQSDTDGKTVRDKMAPVFDELNIDLALQGHDHIYEVMGPIKGKALVANSVKNQISVTFDARTNVTAKQSGIFNTQNGTLYFLNNSAGKKKYEPRSQAQMAAVESGLGLTNYFGMFSGRFGQNGLPTFSNVTVSSDTIEIKTYEVNDLGASSLFDSFKVVKTNNFTTGFNNPLESEKNAVSIYPIPVKNFATINFKEAVPAKVEVYSLNGTLVKSTQINGNTQVDLSMLSKGNYLLKVVSGASNYAVKFVKE